MLPLYVPYPRPGRTATLTVAASNASDRAKRDADYVCNGTNDEVEILAAIAALPTAGGKVVLTDGLFTVGASISTSRSNIEIEGNGWGTQLRLADNINADIDLFRFTADGATSVEFVTIRNLSLNGNKANNSSGLQQGVLFTSQGHAGTFVNGLMQNIYSYNFRLAGLHVQAASDVTIRDCYVTGCTEIGIDLCSGSQVSVQGCHIWSNAVGIWFSGTLTEHAVINGNIIRNNTTAGIYSQTSATGLGDGSGVRVIVSNNQVYANGVGVFITKNNATIIGNLVYNNISYGIKIAKLTGAASVIDTLIANNQVVANGGSGLRIEYATRCLIEGNYCQSNTLHNIYAVDSSYVIIRDNFCYNVATYYGIVLSAAVGETTTNCEIRNNTSLNISGTQDYGIWIDNVRVSGTIIDGNWASGASGAIYDAGTSTVIRRNRGYLTDGAQLSKTHDPASTEYAAGITVLQTHAPASGAYAVRRWTLPAKVTNTEPGIRFTFSDATTTARYNSIGAPVIETMDGIDLGKDGVSITKVELIVNNVGGAPETVDIGEFKVEGMQV